MTAINAKTAEAAETAEFFLYKMKLGDLGAFRDLRVDAFMSPACETLL
jgi:hypothetical protein